MHPFNGKILFKETSSYLGAPEQLCAQHAAVQVPPGNK